MSPIVIPDSDSDESDDRAPSPPSASRQAAASSDAHTRSSDRVSHATVSTDSAFFQSVLNEQIEAAAHESRQLSAAQGRGSNSSARSPAVDKPAGARDAESVRHRASKKCAPGNPSPRTSRKHKMPLMATEKDLWDVPSSPEGQSLAAPPKGKGSRISGIASVKITRGLKRNLEELGYESDFEAIDEESGAQDSDSTHITAPERGRKRKRLDPTGDWVDASSSRLTSSPKDRAPQSRPSMDDTTGADLMSTLPVDGESSFLVAPRALSSSQKGEYQSVDLATSSPSMQPPAPTRPKMGSSGTATNVNTPRSGMASSYDVGITAPTPESEMIGNARRSRRRRRSSSPDVIAVTNHERDGGFAGKQLSKSGPDHDETPGGQVLPADSTGPRVDDDADFSVAPEPVKSKRQRGRPKKSVVYDEAQSNCTTAAAQPDPGPSGASRKKRGRPKKAKQPAETDIRSPGPNTVETHASADAAETGSADATQQQRPKEGKSHQASDTAELAEEATAAASSKRPEAVEERGEARALVGTVKADQPTDQGTTRAPLGSNSKPVYRVGLSKKLRIAPLLKSLPK